MDYAIFSAGILVFFGVLFGWLKKIRPKASIPWILWLVALGITGYGWIYTENEGKSASNQVQQMVEGFPPTYAQEIQLMGHAKLSNSASPTDPIYLAIIAAQIRWQKVNPAIADIYTMRKTDEGKLIFIVDSETDYDRNGKFEGEREKRTPIGEVYEKEMPALERALHGVTTFAGEPETDKWGSTVSAFAPIFNAKGEVEAVLGVDYPAESWIAAINSARYHAMSLIGFVTLLLGASSAVVFTRTHPGA